jgi:type VI protein secretion system component VasA
MLENEAVNLMEDPRVERLIENLAYLETRQRIECAEVSLPITIDLA